MQTDNWSACYIPLAAAGQNTGRSIQRAHQATTAAPWYRGTTALIHMNPCGRGLALLSYPPTFDVSIRQVSPSQPTFGGNLDWNLNTSRPHLAQTVHHSPIPWSCSRGRDTAERCDNTSQPRWRLRFWAWEVTRFVAHSRVGTARAVRDWIWKSGGLLWVLNVSETCLNWCTWQPTASYRAGPQGKPTQPVCSPFTYTTKFRTISIQWNTCQGPLIVFEHLRLPPPRCEAAPYPYGKPPGRRMVLSSAPSSRSAVAGGWLQGEERVTFDGRDRAAETPQTHRTRWSILAGSSIFGCGRLVAARKINICCSCSSFDTDDGMLFYMNM